MARKNGFKTPPLTIQAVLVWIVKQGRPVTLPDVVRRFEITRVNAGVRLLKLVRAGCVRRDKLKKPPRIYRYWPTRRGRDLARRCEAR